MTVTSDCVRVSIQLQRVLVEIEVLIVPDERIMYQVMIDRDFVDRADITLIMRNGCLTIKPEIATAKGASTAADVDLCDIRTTEEARIEPIEKEDRQRCRQLLDEYDDCIFTSLANLGKTSTVTMKIKCEAAKLIVYTIARIDYSSSRGKPYAKWYTNC